MDTKYRQIKWEKDGDVFCVNLRHDQIEEKDLAQLSEEFTRLMEEEKCRKMVLNLGPKEPHCLYSVFLAKLVNLNRRLKEAGGGLNLANVGPNVHRVFEACRLTSVFRFYDNEKSAIEAFES